MAQLSPAARYANQLIHKHNSYPLWDPDPQEQPAVEMADVGYVWKGKFIRLFNAIKQPGDPSNTYGVPSPYRPLEVGDIETSTELLWEVLIPTVIM
jgi:hypothetical protein